MQNIFLIFLGGGLGSVCRYGIGYICKTHLSTTFPFGTLLVNVIGCFLIGLWSVWLQRQDEIPAQSTFLLIVGFCGGFTTFSTFALDSFQLYQNQQIANLILYILLSNLLGLSAVCLGIWIMMLFR
jgi:CrcB protein